MIQLPEKITAWTSGTYSEAELLIKFNQLIDYLKEREEPTSPTPPEPKWKFRDRYLCIVNTGDVLDSVWYNSPGDHARRDFLGVYRTRKEAEAAVVKVKAVLKK